MNLYYVFHMQSPTFLFKQVLCCSTTNTNMHSFLFAGTGRAVEDQVRRQDLPAEENDYEGSLM
jgi:hypothetical protein